MRSDRPPRFEKGAFMALTTLDPNTALLVVDLLTKRSA
jgi:hypothetical protein